MRLPPVQNMGCFASSHRTAFEATYARRGAAGCGERGEATGAGAQDLICRATGEHRNATGAQPVQLALIPIEQVVDPTRQRLNVTIGGGDNVTANEWRSNWHRKA